jgi:hypothetical protein
LELERARARSAQEENAGVISEMRRQIELYKNGNNDAESYRNLLSRVQT